MTREEEIDRAWRGYEVRSNYRYDEKSFKEGAKWADENQNEELHKKCIKNILKILNDYFSIGNSESIWLETEKDYEIVTNRIIEIEKLYY